MSSNLPGAPAEKPARTARVRLERDYLVDLEDAAIIRRDSKGRLRITTPAHHAVAWGTLSGMFWGTLIGLVFLLPLAPLVGMAGGLVGAALGAAENLSIRDAFRQRVNDLVQPGTSAIFVVVRKTTPDKFLEALRPYGGTVLQTSLPHDAEKQLMKALHGDDRMAAPGNRQGRPEKVAATDWNCFVRVPRCVSDACGDCPAGAALAAPATRSVRY